MSQMVADTVSESDSLERRHFERSEVPLAASVAWIRKRHRLYPTHVVDVSLGGLGMILKQCPPVSLGEVLTLEWLRATNETFVARVRSIRSLDLDRWRIGVEWSD
ncbi:MAG: PilZ domain-containing protein [Planctomycetota bacterium]